MTSESGTKINQLLRRWPTGTAATSSWLEKQGAYQQLVHEYVRSSWLESLGKGAFKRSGEKIEWQGALYAIQRHSELPIHVAAKTALALQGINHFLSLGSGYPVYLFGPPNTKLPLWFTKNNWGIRPEYVRTLFLGRQEMLGTEEVEQGAFKIRVSSRERAILEICYLIPQQQGYEEAKLLMESLQTLRPKLVQTLLEQCESVKAKRLFLHLAEACNHPWLKRIDLSQIDLGKGKRSIAQGGIYDSKYQLIVPKIHEGGSDQDERP
jgi:hypothetical protein